MFFPCNCISLYSCISGILLRLIHGVIIPCLVFVWERLFQVKNDSFGEYVIKKQENFLGPVQCDVENDFAEKDFRKLFTKQTLDVLIAQLFIIFVSYA